MERNIYSPAVPTAPCLEKLSFKCLMEHLRFDWLLNIYFFIKKQLALTYSNKCDNTNNMTFLIYSDTYTIFPWYLPTYLGTRALSGFGTCAPTVRLIQFVLWNRRLNDNKMIPNSLFKMHMSVIYLIICNVSANKNKSHP